MNNFNKNYFLQNSLGNQEAGWLKQPNHFLSDFFLWIKVGNSEVNDRQQFGGDIALVRSDCHLLQSYIWLPLMCLCCHQLILRVWPWPRLHEQVQIPGLPEPYPSSPPSGHSSAGCHHLLPHRELCLGRVISCTASDGQCLRSARPIAGKGIILEAWVPERSAWVWNPALSLVLSPWSRSFQFYVVDPIAQQ